MQRRKQVCMCGRLEHFRHGMGGKMLITFPIPFIFAPSKTTSPELYALTSELITPLPPLMTPIYRFSDIRHTLVKFCTPLVCLFTSGSTRRLLVNWRLRLKFMLVFLGCHADKILAFVIMS